MRPMGGEYDQSTLYACMKCHYEANYFVQLTYANKKEFMGEQASENPVSEHELEGGHRSGLWQLSFLYLHFHRHLPWSPLANLSTTLTLPRELVALEIKLGQEKVSMPTGPECWML
jgi:hypothetical protein